MKATFAAGCFWGVEELFRHQKGVKSTQVGYTGGSYDNPKNGDVCYDKNGILGKFSDDMEQRLTIPLVGYGYYKKTRFDKYISKILKAEDVQPKDFFLKEM